MGRFDSITSPELLARYPRSAKYDPAWIADHALGSHCLWLMETLCQSVTLTPGMRVLDLGCGRAISSIFLAREFGVQVWAVDLDVSATDNDKRIQEAGLENHVFPIQADARHLPFADRFFDAVLSINSVQYYGTDDMYCNDCLVDKVKPGGPIGLILPGFRRELDGQVPPSIAPDWGPALHNWHSAAWWRWHLEKTGLVDIELADNLPDNEGFNIFLRWEQLIGDSTLCQRDGGEHVTFVRVVARRKAE